MATNLNPTAARWIADGWEPKCQDDYEWATNTGQYAKGATEMRTARQQAAKALRDVNRAHDTAVALNRSKAGSVIAAIAQWQPYAQPCWGCGATWGLGEEDVKRGRCGRCGASIQPVTAQPRSREAM